MYSGIIREEALTNESNAIQEIYYQQTSQNTSQDLNLHHHVRTS
jgi:hypothetical protein